MSIPPISPQLNVVMETAPRRRIRGLLNAFKEELISCPENDPTTEMLKTWHHNFTQAFETRGTNTLEVEECACRFLKELLIDPLSGLLLEETTYLGSDGMLYGHKTLQLYIHCSPLPYKERSPMNPDIPDPFIVKPYPLANKMIQWMMKDQQPLFSPEEESIKNHIEDSYNQLQMARQLPLLPTQENLPLIQYLRGEEERALQEKLDQERLGHAILDDLKNEIDAILLPFLEEEEQKREQEIAQMEKIKEEAQMMEEIMNKRLALIMEEQRNLSPAIDKIQEELKGVKQHFDELEKVHVALQSAIVETQKILNYRRGQQRQSVFKELLSGLTHVAFSLAATWALQAALGSIAPVGAGGAVSIHSSRFMTNLAFKC